MPFTQGTSIGPYVIEGPLGAGGMGEVYRARDPRLSRDVAVKMLLSDREIGPELLHRFEREARAAAALAHPNILTVFDIGTQDERPYLVTELLQGRTLRERLDDGPFPEQEVLRLGVQLVRGVAAAHALSIIHRDLKPANLFLTEGGVLKILDFGLAKLRPDDPSEDETTLDVSEPGRLVGTPAYMAPEQLRGEEADPRSDLFAIGLVLFEMATGLHPFRRRTSAETTGAVLHEPPAEAPASVSLQPAFERLVRRCLEKKRDARFQTASDLLYALEALVEGDGSSAGATRDASIFGKSPISASVAVLPFVDMSPGQDQAYLCDGIAEELINALSHVGDLRVAARSASFQFRGPAVDLEEAGTRLGVTAVLEGSVRKLGNRLRVSVQLVDAATGYHRWSERFDRELEDVFELEDEIAQRVATALRGVLSPIQQRALRRPEGVVEAYELLLRGRALLHRFERSSFEEALRMFERAIEVDPDYAPAWAGLADIHSWLYEWWGGTPEDLHQADRASERALQLAPGLAESHASRGFVLSLLHRYEEAEEEYIEALRLNPNSFDASYYYARTCFAWGKIERSAELFRRAADLRREDFQSLILLGQSLRVLGRTQEADEANRQGIERLELHLALDPTDARALSLGANALADDGRVEEAFANAKRALELYPDEQTVLINAACLYARLGNKEEALDLLERSFSKGFGKRDWIENDPDYDGLRDDPRFQALLEKLR